MDSPPPPAPLSPEEAEKVREEAEKLKPLELQAEAWLTEGPPLYNLRTGPRLNVITQQKSTLREGQTHWHYPRGDVWTHLICLQAKAITLNLLG